MKSKFGFIPIVLPVLVMVLIVGLINLAGPQGVQANDGAHGGSTTTIDVIFTALDSAGAPIASAAGGILESSKTKQFGSSTDANHGNGDLLDAGRYIVRHFPKATEPDSNRDTVFVGLQTESVAIGVEPDLPAGYTVTVDGLTLPADDDFGNNNNDDQTPPYDNVIGLRRALSEGNNNLVVVIRDGTSSSRHTINVNRAKSTAPAFAGNDVDALQGTYYYQHNVLISSSTYPNQVIQLPKALAGRGNAPFTYSVQEVEAGAGQATIPAGMWLVNNMEAGDYTGATGVPGSVPNPLDITSDPNDSFDPDPAVPIYLAGIPTLLGVSGYSRHEMVYRVTDFDDDSAEIRFTIIITRDKPTLPGDDTTTAVVSPAHPRAIRVQRGAIDCDTDPQVLLTRNVSVELVPAFGKSTNDTYTATVPTDVEVVDIEVDINATSSYTMTVNDLGATPGNIADIGSPATGKTHEWTGQRINRKERGTSAQVRNEYKIKTTVGTGANKAEKTITLFVIREEDKQPEFPVSGPLTYHFFEDTVVGGDSTNVDVPAVKLPVVAKGKRGNADTSTYSMSTSTGLDARYLGLEFGDGAASDPVQPMLTGTTVMDATPQKGQESRVRSIYRVEDKDCNEDLTDANRMKDSDEITVEVRVYRDTTLHGYSADNTPNDTTDDAPVMVEDLGMSSKAVRLVNGVPSLTYRYDDDLNKDGLSDLPAYTYPLPSDPPTTTLQLRVNEESTVAVKVNGTAVKATRTAINGNTAEIDYLVKNVTLQEGDNEVSVMVTNGTSSSASNVANTATAEHVLNIRRPGLAATLIQVKEYEDTRNPDRFSADLVPLDPVFNSAVDSYDLDVETYISAVEITVTQSEAQKTRGTTIAVQGYDIAGNERAKIVDLYLGLNVITVSLTNGVGVNQKRTDYTLNITRLADTKPTFGTSTVADMKTNPGAEFTLDLPEATMGNGDLTYQLVDDDALPLGLTFDGGSTTTAPSISGMARLETGYSSDYYLTYRVIDEDDSGCPNDCDTRSFVITVTKEDLTKTPAPGTPGAYPDGEGPDTLHEIVVDYVWKNTNYKILANELSPPFNPQSGGPYTAMILDDYTSATVTANPSDPYAKVTINQVRIASGQPVVLSRNSTIVVTAPDGSSSKTYTLTVGTITDADPVLPSEISDQVFPANTAIASWQLPEATGGNVTQTQGLTYSLKDGRNALPPGLFFNAETRTLSGTPRLSADAVRTVYEMTYTVTDVDGDTDKDVFLLTVCDSTSPRSGNCQATTPSGNPGYTPMDLTVNRSGASATMTWTPGDDSAKQEVVAVDMSDITGSILATFAQLDGNASSHAFSDLTAGVNYIYIVISYDAAGNYKATDGTGYWQTYTESGN